MPASGTRDRLRISWITNIATAYRAPLWRELAESCELRVLCLASSEPNRGGGAQMLEFGRARVSVTGTPSVPYGQEERVYLYSGEVARHLKVTRPQVVVLDIWYSLVGLQVLFACKRRGIPVILSYRSTMQSHRHSTGPLAWLRGYMLRSAARVMVSGTESALAARHAGVAPDTISTVPYNVVDTEAIQQATQSQRATGPSSPGHKTLYVGQLIDRKNLQTALRAWAAIQGADDTFQICGSGPQEADLRALAVGLSCAERVTFSGHLDNADLMGAYARSQTLVLPSSREVWGLVVNEALAAGLHVVVSARAGVAVEVRGLPGVFVCEPTEDGLKAALLTSRAEWSGPRLRGASMLGGPRQAASSICVLAGSLI